jgi:hypothetical protein
MRARNQAAFILVVISGCPCDDCDDQSVDPCVSNPTLCQQVTNPATVYVDVASTTPQTGLTGNLVASPPAARLSLTSGQAPACTVIFSVAQGGGALLQYGLSSGLALVSADAAGTARVDGWRLGPTAGLNLAQVSGVTCTDPLFATVVIRSGAFEAMAVDPVPASLTKVAGDQQTGTAGQIVTTEPRVLVRAQQNLPMPNAQVTFRVLSGGGSVDGGPTFTAVTDQTGHASARNWRLGALIGTGSNAGRNELEAAVVGLTPAVFTAMAQAGAPLRVVSVSTPAGGAGAAASPEPEVFVTDANGNAVPGISVQFQVTAGGGSVNPATRATDASGRARATWTFGSQAGMLNRLTATVLRNNQPDPAVQGNPIVFEHTPLSTGGICVYVSVDGFSWSGVPVTVTGPESRSGTTGADGTIVFLNVMIGTYTVTIVPPSGTTFPTTSQQVTVTGGIIEPVIFEGTSWTLDIGRGPRAGSPARLPR